MSFFFSPGKLLLTAEYLVLDGALALAVPTKCGQDLQATQIEDGKCNIVWEGLHQGKSWLQIEINYQNWEILSCNLPQAGRFIAKVLENIQKLSTQAFQHTHSYHFKTNLEFPADYGWGSSSTLMTNLAAWAEIDAYLLNDVSLGGSGYDIAVAKEHSAILYRKVSSEERSVEKIQFQPNFLDQLLLVHLNEKQNSREGISLYHSKEKSPALIQKFSELTLNILAAQNLGEFSALMEIHEQNLAAFLEIPTVKEKHFPECPVFLKSLGAWGGDFILTVKFNGYEKYFHDKGYKTILPWANAIA